MALSLAHQQSHDQTITQAYKIIRKFQLRQYWRQIMLVPKNCRLLRKSLSMNKMARAVLKLAS